MIYVLKVDSPIPTTDSETKVDLYHRISLRNPILRVRRAPLREHADPVTVSSEEAAIKEDTSARGVKNRLAPPPVIVLPTTAPRKAVDGPKIGPRTNQYPISRDLTKSILELGKTIIGNPGIHFITTI